MAAGSQVVAGEVVAGALDINGASPRRYFFQVLCSFATDEAERERLEYLATPEGRDDLYRYNQREGAPASPCRHPHTAMNSGMLPSHNTHHTFARI